MRIRRIAVLAASAATSLAALQLVSTRIRTGAAQLRQIVPLDDGGEVLVMLYGITFVAPAQHRPVFESFARGELVPYRVDTWRRRSDGLLAGTIGTATH